MKYEKKILKTEIETPDFLYYFKFVKVELVYIRNS